MDQRSGLWQRGDVSFLGMHSPNAVGLPNLRNVYRKELHDIPFRNRVVVINSGLHDMKLVRQGGTNGHGVVQVIGGNQRELCVSSGGIVRGMQMEKVWK